MPRLPQPVTRSPGFIGLLYNANGIEHKVGVRILAGVDITSLTAMRAAATELADAFATILPDVSFIHDWILQDPTRVELFREPFSPVKSGTLNYGATVASESASLDVPGRGQPAIGLAQGNTRFEFFPGVLVAATWQNKTYNVSGVPEFVAFNATLTGSTVYWADFYGSKANAGANWNTQVNAHYQKKYGL